ncbi:non-specific serine/threonine protein kinase [Ranunculus cassubicifolius]
MVLILELFDYHHDILSHSIPQLLIDHNRETLWTWGFLSTMALAKNSLEHPILARNPFFSLFEGDMNIQIIGFASLGQRKQEEIKTIHCCCQICHRDLKLENTLLDGSPAPRLKICDFGYSKRIMAVQYKIPDYVHVSQDCMHLLSRIFVAHPSRRISIKVIKSHPWFLKKLPRELTETAQAIYYKRGENPSLSLQSIEDIMKIVGEARSPPPSSRTIPGFCWGGQGEEEEEEEEVKEEDEVHASGEYHLS